VRNARTILLVFLLAAAALAAGCGPASWRWGNTQTRRDVYLNLMNPLQRSHYQYLEATERPVSLRLAYLQEIGVYQQWAELPNSIQQAILQRRVVEGMAPLHVQMAWGVPEERRDDTEPAERAEGHTKVVWEYGVRTQKTGGSSYERSVCFLDDHVLWVRQTR